MTAIRERAFAWVAVIVVIISAGALSTAAIIQQVMQNQAPQQSQTALACTDSNTEPTLAVPAPYTPPVPVTQLDSLDLTTGTGAKAKAGDCLVVKYYGTLAVGGTMFDENYTQTTAFAFTLGQGQVITGWDKGLVGMQAGGERRLVIPADQAYGSTSRGNIPANAALVFYVKLLRIQ